VTKRFQILPFKFNLQRYSAGKYERLEAEAASLAAKMSRLGGPPGAR
jgi:hypothetical protein